MKFILKIPPIFIIMYFTVFSIFSQNTTSELENKKRAVFINNIVNQVSGFDNTITRNSYKIAVLDDVPLYKTFKNFSSLKGIISKNEIIPYNYQNLDLIDNVDVLYVNNLSGYTISELKEFVYRKNILLITEGYNFNESIINILCAKGCFYVDINETNLYNDGFTASFNLNKSKVDNLGEWKGIQINKIEEYKQLTYSLTQEQKNLKNEKKQLYLDKKSILKREQSILDTLIKKNRDQYNKVTYLEELNNIQSTNFTNKIEEVAVLKYLYEYQKELVLKTEKKLQIQEDLVLEQNVFFENQKRQIEDQELILKKQEIKLASHRKLNYLLSIIVVMFLSFLSYFIITRTKEKRLIKILEEKNKKIEEDTVTLIRQNKDLEQFAYITSHDLQEPLHTITSFADFIIEDYGDKFDDTGKQYLNFMKQGCSRMSSLIIALLDYSRIGVKRDAVTINSLQLVETILQDLGILIKNTNSKISFGNMPVVNGYEVELRLLFQNLLTNAIKFRKENVSPEIFIEGEKLADEGSNDIWQFKVKDNGIGIKEKHQKTIFNIFKRLHNLEEYQGTGIGLAHCEKIVNLHNGKIWVESTYSEGSTFNFILKMKKIQS